MSKLNEGILDIIDNFLTFILRNDKKGAEKYIKAHPELKSKKKEVDKQLAKAGKAWSKAKRMRANLEAGRALDESLKLEFMLEYIKSNK